MNEPLDPVALAGGSARAWLQRIGTFGSVLALIILGASILLRLTSVFNPQGRVGSALEPALEQVVRMLHRLSASGVALLALCAVVLCWRQRRVAPQLARPTAWIVTSTLVLAIIGPFTPGYRLAAITVVNVSCGVLLLMSFWWLRESVASYSVGRRSVDAFSWLAIVALLLQVGTGAAASAWEMQGVHWPALVHLAWVVLCIIPIGVLLLDQRGRSSPSWNTFAVAGLLAGQVLLGYLLMWQGSRSVGLSFLHAMLAPLLAAGLVSLIKRCQ